MYSIPRECMYRKKIKIEASAKCINNALFIFAKYFRKKMDHDYYKK